MIDDLAQRLTNFPSQPVGSDACDKQAKTVLSYLHQTQITTLLAGDGELMKVGHVLIFFQDLASAIRMHLLTL